MSDITDAVYRLQNLNAMLEDNKMKPALSPDCMHCGRPHEKPRSPAARRRR